MGGEVVAYEATEGNQSTFYASGDSPKAVAKALLKCLPGKESVTNFTLNVSWYENGDTRYSGELFVVH